MNAKHREALRKNRVALVKSLRVEDIRSHMIQDGVLTISHFQSITAKPTRKERAEEFLDILVTRGPNAFKAFTRALRDDYSFLYASLMGKGTERELDLDEENKVLKNENKTLKQYLFKIYRVFEGLLSRPCTTASLMSAIHREKENLKKLLYPAKAPKSQPKVQKTISSKVVNTQKQQTVKTVKEEAAPRIQTAKLTTKPSEETARPKSDGALQVHQNNSGDCSEGTKSAPLSKTSTTKITTTKPVFLGSHKSTSSTSAKETTVSKTNNKALTTKGNTNSSPSPSPTEKEEETSTVTVSYSLLSETTTPKQINVEDYDQTLRVCQHTVETEDVGKRKTTQKETGTLQKDSKSPLQTDVRERSAVKTQNSGTEADILQKPAQGTPGKKSKKQDLSGTIEEDLSQKAKHSMAAMDQEGQGSTNLKKPPNNTQGIKAVPTCTNNNSSKHDSLTVTGRVKVSGTAGVNRQSTHQQVSTATSQGDRNQAVGKAAYSPGKVTVSGSSGSSTKSPDTTRRQNTPTVLTRTQTSKVEDINTVVRDVCVDKPNTKLLSARPKQAPPTLRNVKETQKASGEKRSQTTQQSSKRRGSVIKIRFEEGRLSRVDIREDNDDTDSASATGSCP